MHHKTAGTAYSGRRSPEEIVLDGWLEDLGPYVSLRDTKGLRAPGSGLRAGPVVRARATDLRAELGVGTRTLRPGP
jgi:hypothetical protein